MIITGEAAMVAFGEQLGCQLQPLAQHSGAVVFLEGDLGAGKTTLCRGVLQAYGYSGAVKSPTYTLVEPYQLDGRTVFHFDLYRLGDPEELEYMGMRDYFGGGNLCLVEWPKRGKGFLPEADLSVTVTVAGEGRQLQLSATTEAGRKLLAALQET